MSPDILNPKQGSGLRSQDPPPPKGFTDWENELQTFFGKCKGAAVEVHDFIPGHAPAG